MLVLQIFNLQNCIILVLMRQGDYNEARSHYEHALKLRYPYPDCVYNLGK